MATAERVFWETVGVLAFAVLLVAAWLLSGVRAERKLEAAREEQRQELASRTAEHQAALARLEEARREEAAAHRRAEAEAVFRAFAAGLQPAALERWRRYLGAARAELERSDPAIAFVHLTTPDGYVLTSTDPRLNARGRLGEGAEWVLAADAIVSRETDGVLELAGPIRDGTKPVAYLWIGYEVGAQ